MTAALALACALLTPAGHVAALQLPHPSASVKYDSGEADAHTTRVRLLQMAASKHMIVGAAHIAFPGLGHLRRRDGMYDWLPVNYDGAPASNAVEQRLIR